MDKIHSGVFVFAGKRFAFDSVYASKVGGELAVVG